MKPMLASPGPAGAAHSPPVGPAWQHEVKWDGVRLLADVKDGVVRLRTRSGREVSAGFPEFSSLAEVARDALLDGEAIAWQDGTPSFSRVVERVHIPDTAQGRATAGRHAAQRPATFVVFDLLRLDGLTVTGLPLRHRRAALEAVWNEGPGRALSQTYADGQVLFAATARQGLEGVVSKRLDSVYLPGVRSHDWLKFPHRATRSYVVGGWRRETGSQRLGAVLVGSPSATTDGRLRFRGRVGSGLVGRAGAELSALLTTVEHDECPFADDVPAIDRRGTVWVAPRVVIDVASLPVTGRSRLRQPAYQRLRTDLAPEQLDAVAEVEP
ncbi:MAG: DNA ligase [Ornithinimicrobium sp.]